MKRVGHLYEKMISDENILRAILTVNLSHRWRFGHKPNKTVVWVEVTLGERVKELREIIENGFVPEKPTIKHRYDKNAKKLRDIAEPRLYPDQYIHHILIQVLEPVMMRGMDRYCCGSIKHRGAIYGVRCIKKWMKDDLKGTKHCLEMDIRHFYDNLQPSEVMKRFRRLIKDRKVLDLIERVMIYGVLIGAFFSQWFANTFLQPLDEKIRKLGAKHYIRYIDNFTVFSSNKRILKKVVKMTGDWLNGHGMELKGNWQRFKTKDRMPDALGYRYGHGFTLIRKHRIITMSRQIKSFFKQKEIVSANFALSLLSRIGGLKHCDGRTVRDRSVPIGLQRKLKNIVRAYQRKTLIAWEIARVKMLKEVMA